jgi:membrane protein implicated in regulation of membrane protease activity
MSAPFLVLGVLLALAAVVLLWKLLLTAGLIAAVQWAIVTHADDTTVQVLTFAVPALLVAFALSRLLPARHAVPTTRKGVTR